VRALNLKAGRLGPRADSCCNIGLRCSIQGAPGRSPFGCHSPRGATPVGRARAKSASHCPTAAAQPLAPVTPRLLSPRKPRGPSRAPSVPPDQKRPICICRACSTARGVTRPVATSVAFVSWGRISMQLAKGGQAGNLREWRRSETGAGPGVSRPAARVSLYKKRCCIALLEGHARHATSSTGRPG